MGQGEFMAIWETVNLETANRGPLVILMNEWMKISIIMVHTHTHTQIHTDKYMFTAPGAHRRSRELKMRKRSHTNTTHRMKTRAYTLTVKYMHWLGNKSHCLPSLFMSAWKHLARRQARHWLRWVLSMGQRPLSSPWALHVYTRHLWMLRLKNPEQPAHRAKPQRAELVVRARSITLVIDTVSRGLLSRLPEESSYSKVLPWIHTVAFYICSAKSGYSL